MIDILTAWWLIPFLWLGIVLLLARFVHNGTKKPTPAPGVCNLWLKSARGIERCCYGPPHPSRAELWEREFKPILHDDVVELPRHRPFDRERD